MFEKILMQLDKKVNFIRIGELGKGKMFDARKGISKDSFDCEKRNLSVNYEV